jgi:hypothetical protein
VILHDGDVTLLMSLGEGVHGPLMLDVCDGGHN